MSTKGTSYAPPKKFETLHMVDGRIYMTPDNWETVYIKRGRMRLVTDKEEADTVRFIAIAQSSGGPA